MDRGGSGRVSRSSRRIRVRTLRVGFRCRSHVYPRLRVPVMCFGRVLGKLKSVYKQLLISVASVGRDSLKALSSTAKKPAACVCTSAAARPSFARSNSFYAEAVAECLEFIKRSSSAVDSRPVNAR
jgi:hypothetical protein